MGLTKWFNKTGKVQICIIVALVFGVYMVFFSEYNYMETIKYESEIKELKMSIREAQDSAVVYEQKLNALNSDKEAVERVVREEYHMKRENEDIYLTKEK